MNRYRARNPNWKGGLSLFKTADDLLSLPQSAQDEISRRLSENLVEDADTGCWNWIGSVFKSSGRPSLNLGCRRHLAYRLIYVIEKGVLGKLLVLHTCDNPTCLNPEHLVAGTSKDNTDDMFSKGREVVHRGSTNGAAVLDEERVAIIRQRLAGKPRPTLKTLATEFGVSVSLVSLIDLRKIWRHVP